MIENGMVLDGYWFDNYADDDDNDWADLDAMRGDYLCDAEREDDLLWD